MKLWREFEANRVSVVGGVCDRCGGDAKLIGGFMDRIWGFFSGRLQGGDRVEADLCQSCVDALVEWVNEGEGRGVVDERQISADHAAYERMEPLEDAVRFLGLGVDLATESAVVELVRKRGGR